MTADIKYILVTGGTLSGVGKGVTASSIGVVLQSKGYAVTFIKIDPYINLDAGTLNPFDHGEVYVLEDGAEVDLDLGNYERFLDISLTGKHCITTGKIFHEILRRERSGLFLGKTVQMVPHVTDLILESIEEASTLPIKMGVSFESNAKIKPEICIIELGGTVGDIESLVFVESLRQLKRKTPINNFLTISVEFIPQLTNKELKTKPIQNSFKKSLSFGIKPDIIICRSEVELDKLTKEKICNFCEVNDFDIFQSKTLKNVYDLPSEFNDQGIFDRIKLHLQLNDTNISEENISVIGNSVEQNTVTRSNSVISTTSNYCVGCRNLINESFDSNNSTEDSNNQNEEKDSINEINSEKDLKNNKKIKLEKDLTQNESPIQKNELINQPIKNSDTRKEEEIILSNAKEFLFFSLKEKFSVLSKTYDTKLKVSIIGKYVGNSDCYISLHNAIKFSAAHLGMEAIINWVEAADLEVIDPHELLCDSDCIIVPGGFGPRGVEGKINAIKYARINNVPFLGICLGFQMAVVEFARNVLGMKNAHSEEFKQNKDNVVIYLNNYDQKSFGGTMRVGNKATFLADGRIKEWYKVKEKAFERHRHRYEVKTSIINFFEEKGFEFVGKNDKNERMEVFDYKYNDFFIGVQFHPEFNARPNAPHCLFTQLLNYGLKRKKNN